MKFVGIQLSPMAAQSARALQEAESDYQSKFLRLYLDGKGCDGFYYGVTFDSPLPNDIHFESQGLKILVDSDAVEFVDGSTIDWVDDERGRGFLVDNPHHRKFRGKFYKRASWQEKLKEKIVDRSGKDQTTAPT